MNVPRRRDGEATKERLLQAALDLYTTVGFLPTTTPALAARAEVAEGTIYRHFSSKEHLLNEAYRRAQRWALAELEAVANDRVRRPAERLAVLGRALVDAAGKEPSLIRMLFSTAHEGFLDDQSLGTRRALLEGLEQLMASGKADGQVRAGPAELWAGVWLTLVRHAAERVASGEWAADGAPAALTLEAAWDAVAARGV